MKSSINFLPAEKRRDLHQLVEIIYGHEIEMYTVEQGEKRDKWQ